MGKAAVSTQDGNFGQSKPDEKNIQAEDVGVIYVCFEMYHIVLEGNVTRTPELGHSIAHWL